MLDGKSPLRNEGTKREQGSGGIRGVSDGGRFYASLLLDNFHGSKSSFFLCTHASMQASTVVAGRLHEINYALP